MKSIKLIRNYIFAVLLTFILASVAHSQMVLAGLKAIAVEVPWELSIGMTVSDLAGLAPSYGAIIAVSLLLGFVLSRYFVRLIPLGPVQYPLAGGFALWLALMAMQPILGVTIIAGARTSLGLILQTSAGVVGGVLFYLLQRGNTLPTQSPSEVSEPAPDPQGQAEAVAPDADDASSPAASPTGSPAAGSQAEDNKPPA